MNLNKHSSRLTQDESQPASQAMLYAVGLTDEDMQKAPSFSEKGPKLSLKPKEQQSKK